MNINDDKRMSISGCAIFVFGYCACWRSKLHTITAGSTHEAELIAIALAANEGSGQEGFARGCDSAFPDLPPPPRKAGILEGSELLSGPGRSDLWASWRSSSRSPMIRQLNWGLLQKTQIRKMLSFPVIARTPFWSFCAGFVN